MVCLRSNRRRKLDLIFFTVDSFLIFAGVLAAGLIRFSNSPDGYLLDGYGLVRVVFIVFLIQLGFYFFELYEPRICYGRRKMLFIRLSGSLATSYVLIFVANHLVPSLNIGYEVFAVYVLPVFIFSFSWRLLYSSMSKSPAMAERVLIIGTGPLAKKVGEEIANADHSGFEIVGFIDESRERITEQPYTPRRVQ